MEVGACDGHHCAGVDKEEFQDCLLVEDVGVVFPFRHALHLDGPHWTLEETFLKEKGATL